MSNGGRDKKEKKGGGGGVIYIYNFPFLFHFFAPSFSVQNYRSVGVFPIDRFIKVIGASFVWEII